MRENSATIYFIVGMYCTSATWWKQKGSRLVEVLAPPTAEGKREVTTLPNLIRINWGFAYNDLCVVLMALGWWCVRACLCLPAWTDMNANVIV